MTNDPIYGDRRCPTCQAIKLHATDDCWNCTRRVPTREELDCIADAAADAIALDVDRKALEALDAMLAAKTDDHLTDYEIAAAMAGPFIAGKHQETLTVSRVESPAARMAARSQINAVILRVRAYQSYDVKGDAVQLARWLQEAMTEIDELRAANAALLKQLPDD